MLRGELRNERGEQEVVGLERIQGYSCQVHRMKPHALNFCNVHKTHRVNMFSPASLIVHLNVRLT